MHIKEIEKVSGLSPLERYQYFIKKIADSELLYTLIFPNDNYAISSIDSHNLFPVWSAEEFASNCKIAGWEESIIKEISFDDLEEWFFDFIVENNYLLNVFPVGDKTGFIVDLEEFTKDLKSELDKY